MALSQDQRDFLRTNDNTVFVGQNSFSSFGPIVWNEMLPAHIKNQENVIAFKNSLKLWVPTNCQCRLCKTYMPGLGFIDILDD